MDFDIALRSYSLKNVWILISLQIIFSVVKHFCLEEHHFNMLFVTSLPEGCLEAFCGIQIIWEHKGAVWSLRRYTELWVLTLALLLTWLETSRLPWTFCFLVCEMYCSNFCKMEIRRLYVTTSPFLSYYVNCWFLSFTHNTHVCACVCIHTQRTNIFMYAYSYSWPCLSLSLTSWSWKWYQAMESLLLLGLCS